MRLIDADDLLTAFPIGDEPTVTIACIRATIKHMPTIEERKTGDLISRQPEQRWIPVAERLPKEYGDYLVTTHNGQIARYVFMGKSFEEYWRRNATAWMPLPEPYVERRTDDSTIEERKTGQWIDDKRQMFDGTFHWFRKCDQCYYERTDDNPDNDSNFCPNCGADMRGVK